MPQLYTFKRVRQAALEGTRELISFAMVWNWRAFIRTPRRQCAEKALPALPLQETGLGSHINEHRITTMVLIDLQQPGQLHVREGIDLDP